MSDTPKRRLPMLQATTPADDDAPHDDRPAWHWAFIGGVFALLAWLPLAAAALTAAVRLAGDPGPGVGATPRLAAASIVLGALSFATASLAAGALVGRFGGKAGLREATLTGPFAGAVAWALSVSQDAPGPGALVWALLLVVLGALGAGASRVGGRLGLRARGRAAAA